MSVLRGDGDGTFPSAVNYLVGYNGAQPTSLVVGNFTGHGQSDLAVTNWDSNSVSVLLNQNDGSEPGRGAAPKAARPAASPSRLPLPKGTLTAVAALKAQAVSLEVPASPTATPTMPPPGKDLLPPSAFLAAPAVEERSVRLARPSSMQVNGAARGNRDGGLLDELGGWGMTVTDSTAALL